MFTYERGQVLFNFAQLEFAASVLKGPKAATLRIDIMSGRFDYDRFAQPQIKPQIY